MTWTVFGSSGFIGSHLVSHLQEKNLTVNTPGRDEDLQGQDLGTAIYCIGMTADFRSKPFETVDAHVLRLQQILQNNTFEKFVYLSSTRVYAKSEHGNEDALIGTEPENIDHLYNISKIMGESLVHAANGTVVRLSNVYGNDTESENFLTSVIRAAIESNHIDLLAHPDSQKDFISVNDVVSLLFVIGESGTQQTYNVASGHNKKLGDIVDMIAEITGCTVKKNTDALCTSFPAIDISGVQSEFQFTPQSIDNDIRLLVDLFRS